MNAPIRQTIRARLMLLAVVVAVPLSVLAANNAWERYQTETRRQTEHASELAALAARGLDAQIAGTETLLEGLSQALDPTARPEANDSILVSLFRNAPVRFANIWIADTLGHNIGSARLPGAGRASATFADRDYFRDAMRTRRFVVGRVFPSRTVPDAPPVLTFAMPMLDVRTKAVRAIVGASILADSLDGLRVAKGLPPGSAVTVFDSSRSIVWRTIDARRFVGRSLKGDSDVEANFARSSGVGARVGVDGVRRLIAYQRLTSVGWTVFVGIPTQYTVDVAEAQLRRDALGGVVVVALVLLLAYFVARRIVAPIASLTDDATAIAQGDETRRSTIQGDDEIGALATAFNQMAATNFARRTALKESEERYRVLFSANPLPMVAWSPATGLLLDANPAALATFGYSRETFVGQSVAMIVHPDEHERFQALLAPASSMTIPMPEGWAGLWRTRHADGHTLDMEVFASRFPRGDRVEVVIVAIDIGARRATETALEESREQLRQAQKMEALGSFAGGMAHEFNNYLSSIIGFTELAEANLAPGSSERADLREVLGAALRAAELTRQILVFSRKQVVEPEVLDPGHVVRDFTRLLTPLLGERISITTDLASDAGFIKVDKGQLEQVLVNLAANARDAMPAGGDFLLRTSRVVITEEQTEHQALPAGDWLRLSAIDTGVGIEAALHERIFEPFFTTKERGHGTGLGLALVYSIVQQAGGLVRMDSQVGRGTSFHLYFPRHITGITPRSVQAIRAHAPRGSERVLVVEDDALVRQMTQQLLTRAGYTVQVAEDGPNALDVLRSSAEPFALMLTDVVMPGMNGAVLADAARALYPSLLVMFMSGYADDDVLVQLASADAVAFVAKPFTSDVMLRKVREVLDAPRTATSTR